MKKAKQWHQCRLTGERETLPKKHGENVTVLETKCPHCLYFTELCPVQFADPYPPNHFEHNLFYFNVCWCPQQQSVSAHSFVFGFPGLTSMSLYSNPICCKLYQTILNYGDSVNLLSSDIINRVCCCCCLWSSNLLSWMRDSAPSVCERAHGRGDKIITMVTTGCGPSQGMLGESHTDANSLRGTYT